jgi:hypothetical protein
MITFRTGVAVLALCASLSRPQTDALAASTPPGDIPSSLAAAEKLLDRQGPVVRYRWARSLPWKEATDNCFLPMFLLRELGSRTPLLVGRALGYPYTGLQRPILAGSMAGARRIGTALSALRLGQGRCVRFKLVEANLFAIGTEYPVLLCWRGVMNRSGGVARVCWYEPILSRESIAYAVNANNDGVRWNTERSVQLSHYGDGFSPPYTARYRSGGPSLDLGLGVYTIDASLALWPVVELRPKMVPRGRSDARAAVQLDGPVNWSGGEGRREIFRFDGDRLRSIHIIQPEVQLNELVGAGPVEIRYTSHGIVQRANYWPRLLLRYLKSGRKVVVRFGTKVGTPLAGYPSTIVVWRHSARRFVARFSALRYFTGVLPPTPWHLRDAPKIGDGSPATHSRINGTVGHAKSQFSPPRVTPGWRLRVRFTRNVSQNLDRERWKAMRRALTSYRKLLQQERVPARFFVFDVEILTNHACSYGPGMRVKTMTRRFLEPAYSALQPRQIARLVAQHVDQYRYGLAVAAADSLHNDPKAGSRLRRWAGATAERLEALIAAIKRHPGPYHRYAVANSMSGQWRRLTKENELIAEAVLGNGE